MMKTYPLLLCALLPLSNLSALTGKIQSVVIYPDAAQVKRSVTVSAKDLDEQGWLHIESLPANLDDKRIHLNSSEGLLIKDIQFSQLEKDALEERPEIKEIDQKMDALLKELSILQQSRQLAQNQSEFARQLSKSFSQNFGKNPLDKESISLAQETWQYAHQAIEEATRLLNENSETIEATQEKLETLRAERNELWEKIYKLRGELNVQFQHLSAETSTLNLQYWVYDCQWKPRYELHASLDQKSIDIQYQAEITQKTGEDWLNVECILNTYTLNRKGSAPTLKDLVLQPISDQPIYTRQKAARSMDSVMMMQESMPAPPAFGMDKEAKSTRGFASFEIVPESRLNVSSDTPQKTTLMRREFKADFWSEIVAPSELRAYLKGEIKNGFDIPMLPGEAYTYADGQYLSQVYLDYTLPEETLSLSLGVDDSVKVTRKALLHKEQDAGLIDKTTRHQRRYQTVVENLHPIAHRFRIYDRIPKSQNAKLEIQWKEPKAKHVHQEKGSHVFYWDLSIPANAEKKLYTAFDVIHPREWHLNSDF